MLVCGGIGDDRLVRRVHLQRGAWPQRVHVSERLHHRLRVDGGQPVNVSRVGFSLSGRKLAELLQQLLDLLHLKLVGPQHQGIVPHVGFDPELVGALRSAAATRGWIPERKAKGIVAPTALGAVALFLFPTAHHECDGLGDRLGPELLQRNHVAPSPAAVQLAHQHLDRCVVEQIGVGDDRPVDRVYFQTRAGIQVAHLFQGLDHGRGVDRLQTVDLVASHVVRRRIRPRYVQGRDRLCDNHHLVGRGTGQDAVLALVDYQAHPPLGWPGHPATTGLLGCGGSLGRHLLHLLHLLRHLLLHLLLHLLHGLGAPSSGRAASSARTHRHPQQRQHVRPDILGPGVLQRELPHQLLLAFGRLLVFEEPPQLPQIDHRVHRLHAIAGAQRRELRVRAQQRLELFHRLMRHHPLQGKVHLDELVRVSLIQLVGLDPRNHARIELLDLHHPEGLLLADHRVPAGQQVPVDHVADFAQRVLLLRDQVQIVSRQLLPVEAQTGKLGKPAKHIGPRVAGEVQLDLAVFVQAHVPYYFWVGGLGRCGGTFDRLRISLGLLLFPRLPLLLLLLLTRLAR